MKTIPLLIATALVAALVVAPMAFAAGGSISFSSPSAGSSFKDSQSYTISGTVSPAPGQADSAFISVTNPAGKPVDAGSVPVSPNSGTFTYSTAVGGTSSWTTGTYTISVTDSLGATGSMTFTYTAPAPTASYNVTKALTDIEGNLTQIKAQITALLNSEATEQKDMKANFTAISQALTALSGQITTITTNLGTVQTDVTNIQGQLTTLSNNVATLNTAVNAAQMAATAAQTAATNAQNSVSSTQTYVLVVAVLAAITLVLELAILVRKLS